MTTKSDIGLSNVQDFPVATGAQAIDPSVTNAYMTPAGVWAMITQTLAAATADSSGVVTINTGVNPLDGSNQTAVLTAAGLANIIGSNPLSANLVQTELLSLFGRSTAITTSVAGDANGITVALSPSTPTNKLAGVVRFTAKFTNTGPVTFSSGGAAMPVLHWNGDEILPGEIKAADNYGLFPLNNHLILIDPTPPSNGPILSYADNLMQQHVGIADPHPNYASQEQLTNAVTVSFKGAYIPSTTLIGTQYTANSPGGATPAGLFSITFTQSNPESAGMSVNGVSKPIVMPNGTPVPLNTIKAGETRQLTATADVYILSSAVADISAAVSDSILGHLAETDPHNQYLTSVRGQSLITSNLNDHKAEIDPHGSYWNDARGNAVVITKVSEHEGSTNPHPQYMDSSQVALSATNKIGIHSLSIDPHGDRAYADSVTNNHIAGFDPHNQYTTTARAQTIVDNTFNSKVTNTPSSTLSTTASAGASSSIARADHVHAHGNLLGGALHSAATANTDGFMSSLDKTKIDGMQAGAQVNSVTSVAGKTGQVTVTKADVGLGSVDNTSDANKPVSLAQAASIATKANIANSLAGYGITDAYNKTETDSRIQAIVGSAPAALDTLAEIATEMTADKSGVVALTTAVSLKAPIANPVFTGSVGGITSAMVGLGNVDNTSDINKPVSTAQAAANTLVQSTAAADATAKANAAQAAAIAASTSGNTATTTKLQNARLIAGTSFDGTSDIVIPFANLTNKPTTLAGYGITDASATITSGTINTALGYTAANATTLTTLSTNIGNTNTDFLATFNTAKA